MDVLYGNCLVGQSGGPTAAINAALLGVINAATAASEIKHVYGMLNGIEGVLRDEIIDLDAEDPDELKKLKYTPSSILGSCRYKLDADRDYKRISDVLQSHNIRYFFYIGGNDSMDTCNKISKHLTAANYDCRVIGIPKTIDNDLVGTDHCPGYGSAAKFIATACMELKCDTEVYHTPTVNIVEIMGRHAGWLAGAAALGNALGNGPDLVYLPECDFNLEQFYADVQQVIDENGSCLVAVSEGIHYADGSYIQDLATAANDGFGHVQLGGLGVYLAELVKTNLHCKARGIELSLLQRCGSHCASETDLSESISAGTAAVNAALTGKTDIMIGFTRSMEQGLYVCNTCESPLTDVANAEKTVPRAWINEKGNGVTRDFIDYAFPLIQGEPDRDLNLSLPCFAKLKKIHC
jgi:ATP-dependent phosphofructokinase / diphosphate-dependent phosphofructokinase